VKIRKNLISTLVLLVGSFVSCQEEDLSIPHAPQTIDLSSSFYYEVNLDDRSDDTFKVRMFVDDLTEDNAIIQFPATTPGTYDIHDIGRYVTTFKAYDANYNELDATHSSTNQWTLSDPENTHILEFEVKETFDTPVAEHDIYKMAGTSIENRHTLFNAFDILCYPTGLKERDFYLNIDYPSSWSVGTSLPKENGFYFATDYDKLVDSPLLMGFITSASVVVDGAEISVHSFSQNNLIQASQILNDMTVILNDASAFLNGLPVDRYSFLYLFDEFGAGALEHSYSSVYVLHDQPYSPDFGESLRNIAAHEFFHIVTPLNIHSEIIEDFNFAVPTPSEHLWLYEGVTEWASHMMQYRNQTINLTTLLAQFQHKKAWADAYSQTMSLSEMSLTCYTQTGGAEFGNVYNKGALVAALLDIRLLELSGGTKGLREVILDLIEEYGADQAFSEENFFDDLAQLTGYPTEINDFLNRYVAGTDALPLVDYFNLIGITYNPGPKTFTVNGSATAEQVALRNKWSVNF
jgi:predicted metalloprotease with PDZ domain